MKEQVEKELQSLINQPLLLIQQIKSVTNVCFGFELINADSESDEIQFRHKYVIYIRCPWRLRGPEGIVTGFDDRFNKYGEDRKISIVDKEDDLIQKNLVFEKWSTFVKEKGEQLLIVISISVNQMGDCQLALSNGYYLEIFPDGPSGFNEWGYINHGISEADGWIR